MMEKRVEIYISFNSDSYETGIESAEILVSKMKQLLDTWVDTYSPYTEYTVNGKSKEEAERYV